MIIRKIRFKENNIYFKLIFYNKIIIFNKNNINKVKNK